MSIEEAICKVCNVTNEQIFSKNRQIDIVYAKFIYTKLKFNEGLTCKEIAEMMNVNYRTVTYNVQSFNDRLKFDSKLRIKYNEVKELLCYE